MSQRDYSSRFLGVKNSQERTVIISRSRHNQRAQHPCDCGVGIDFNVFHVIRNSASSLEDRQFVFAKESTHIS